MKILNKPIEMICIISRDGKIYPRKFKFMGLDEKEHIIEIQRIQKIEEYRVKGLKTRVFTCEVEYNKILRICVLHYAIENTIWGLFKM